MANAPRLEKVAFQKCSEVTSKNKIECKLGVCEEDLEILNGNANACLLSAEISGGEIRYSGKAIFNAVCQMEKEPKIFESGVEFSFKCSSGVSGLNQMLNLASVTVCDVEVTKQNGVLLGVATVVFSGEVCYEEEFEQIAVNGVDLLTKKHYVEKCDRIAKVEKTFTVQDDFEVNGIVKTVICHTEKAYLSSSQCGIGSVIYDGEVELSIILKTSDELGGIIKETRHVPFRLESEISDVIPSLIAISNACVNGSAVKVYVDETKNKSSITVVTQISLSSTIYEAGVYNYCQDAYSTSNNLKTETSKKVVESIVEVNYKEQKIVGDLAYFDENAGLICILNDKIEEISTSYKNGELLVKGVIKVDLLLNDNGLLKTQTSLVPFETSFLADCNAVKNVNCLICNAVVERLDQKFTLSCTLKVSYACINQKTATVLVKVEEGDKKVQNDSAISVYIASKGDELWDVCKALNVSEAVILSNNPDLTFPLEKEERILIYRELNKE